MRPRRIFAKKGVARTRGPAPRGFRRRKTQFGGPKKPITKPVALCSRGGVGRMAARARGPPASWRRSRRRVILSKYSQPARSRSRMWRRFARLMHPIQPSGRTSRTRESEIRPAGWQARPAPKETRSGRKIPGKYLLTVFLAEPTVGRSGGGRACAAHRPLSFSSERQIYTVMGKRHTGLFFLVPRKGEHYVPARQEA